MVGRYPNIEPCTNPFTDLRANFLYSNLIGYMRYREEFTHKSYVRMHLAFNLKFKMQMHAEICA
jgi:hypothetical protein